MQCKGHGSQKKEAVVTTIQSLHSHCLLSIPDLDAMENRRNLT